MIKLKGRCLLCQKAARALNQISYELKRAPVALPKFDLELMTAESEAERHLCQWGPNDMIGCVCPQDSLAC